MAVLEGWKGRLKERCLERVRQDRERYISEIRGLATPSPSRVSPLTLPGHLDGAAVACELSRHASASILATSSS
jgi:surfactin synthase thioesterase subunit